MQDMHGRTCQNSAASQEPGRQGSQIEVPAVNIALVVVGDGRWEYEARALDSLREFISAGVFSYWRVVDDSGGPSPMAYTGDWDVIRHDQRRGLAAAVQSAWVGLPSDIEYVFHFELDFVLNGPVEFDRMVKTLEANPHLAQLVLKRQPGCPSEVSAGGIIEQHPDEYADRAGWVEHHRIFSLNPCLIPRRVVDMGWPVSNEAGFTTALVNTGFSFGFWGARHDPPRVIHIGAERSSGWMP